MTSEVFDKKIKPIGTDGLGHHAGDEDIGCALHFNMNLLNKFYICTLFVTMFTQSKGSCIVL